MIIIDKLIEWELCAHSDEVVHFRERKANEARR